jgi:crossover junction endodeoxyribonuclease RuvC
MIVTGLDLSLTSTGVATINTITGGVVVDRVTSTAPDNGRDTKGKKLPPRLVDRTARLHSLRMRIVDLARNADLVVVEGPSYGSTTGSQHDRSGLWWLVVHRLHVLDPKVAEVPPANRMKYATGKARTDKDVVLAAVVRRYAEVEVTSNDEADALILAAMGARWLGSPIEASLPASHLQAMSGVRWPEGGLHER